MRYKDKEYLINQYCNGKTIIDIANDLDVSKSTIWKYFKKFGIKMDKVRSRRVKVYVECSNCQKPLMRYPSTLSERNFCGYECYHSWMVGNTTGKNSNNWKGGVTAISSDNLKTPEFRALKKIVLRDFPFCVMCGNTSHLHIHHIKTRRECPELAFDKKNLITLCRSCHAHIKGSEKNWEKYFTRLICKGDELRETLNSKEHGNPQPSQSNVIDIVGWKVQRLTVEDSQTNKTDTSVAPERDEIVRAYGKP